MKLTQSADIRVIFGNGSLDRELVKKSLEYNRDKFCEIEISIPESGGKGKGINVYKGIHGVIRFIKGDASRFTSSYIVFIDKEHCSGDYLDCVVEVSKQYGVRIEGAEKLSADVYKFRANTGDKDFTMYFVFQGIYCCIEDLILIACGVNVDEHRGEGCCKYYKERLKKLGVEKRCESKAVTELFNLIRVVLSDIGS